MNARLLGKIGLRILAVYLVGLGFWLLPQYFMFVHDKLPDHSVTANLDYYLELIFNPTVFGLILWFLAPRIAKWSLDKQESAAPASTDAADWQTVGFTVLGVYFVLVNLPAVLSLLIVLTGHGLDDQIQQDGAYAAVGDHLIVSIGRLLLGAVLVLGAGYFTRLFRRFRAL
ncbi:MAG TPA: hypothetical protein VGV16_02635 [Gammaproteobacteria bacterium]|nr:hypothetical protein [Gammaproteobacteria bacterium]